MGADREGVVDGAEESVMEGVGPVTLLDKSAVEGIVIHGGYWTRYCRMRHGGCRGIFWSPLDS